MRLDEGQQSLILLNRRGFATSVLCRQCGASLECPNCSVTLTVHTAAGDARLERPVSLLQLHEARCRRRASKCAAPYMERIGFGTERVEAEIREAFPAARVARVDRDTVRRKGSLVEMLEQVAAARSTC